MHWIVPEWLFFPTPPANYIEWWLDDDGDDDDDCRRRTQDKDVDGWRMDGDWRLRIVEMGRWIGVDDDELDKRDLQCNKRERREPRMESRLLEITIRIFEAEPCGCSFARAVANAISLVRSALKIYTDSEKRCCRMSSITLIQLISVSINRSDPSSDTSRHPASRSGIRYKSWKLNKWMKVTLRSQREVTIVIPKTAVPLYVSIDVSSCERTSIR